MNKKRLDMLVIEKDSSISRTRAKSLIMEGLVYVNNNKETKPGAIFSIDDLIEIKKSTKEFVSRGGYKLKKAITNNNIILKDKVCVDIGSSTGGFTDCMLQNGAKKVYAVDVGYGQLDWSLRNNSKVISMEKTNARYLSIDNFNEKIDFISVDVAFISLTKILNIVYNILNNKGEAICLIKPQFEAKRSDIKKNGVVKDSKVHEYVINEIIEFAKDIGFKIISLDFSPIKGPKGNIEYLLFIKKNDDIISNVLDVRSVINNAFNTLNKEIL